MFYRITTRPLTGKSGKITHFGSLLAARNDIQSLIRGLYIGLALLVLSGCLYNGKPVSRLAEALPWFSLPLDEFLHESQTEAEAISFCAAPECQNKLAIGVFSAHGNEAEQLERILHKPELLATEIKNRERRLASKRVSRNNKPHVDVAIKIEPVIINDTKGFSLVMSRKDGKGYVAALVLGKREHETLRVVIAIGDNKEVVAKAAMETAWPTDPKAAPTRETINNQARF